MVVMPIWQQCLARFLYSFVSPENIKIRRKVWIEGHVYDLSELLLEF
jgi:hypothetical protein